MTKALLAAALLACTGIALATEPDEVLTALKQRYPATHFDAVKPSPVAGLFEVTMGKNVAYVEPTGRYFLFGHLYDMPGNRDLTADAMPADSPVKERLVDWTSLPPADGILIQQGRGAEIVVFSDPLCSYCRRLEATLASMPDVTVRLYPLPLLTGSDRLVGDIWCATDPAAAWAALTKGKGPPRASTAVPVRCDTAAIERNRALAQRLGVRGTPTIVASDGRMLAGAVDASALRHWLADSSPSHARMETSPQ